jgi:hypothetical protein
VRPRGLESEGKAGVQPVRRRADLDLLRRNQPAAMPRILAARHIVAIRVDVGMVLAAAAAGGAIVGVPVLASARA